MNYKRKIILAVVAVILAVAIAYGIEAYQGISKINDKVIRFHVIANSNTFEDQQLKYKVRNSIISSFDREFQNITTKDESEKIIVDKIDDIRKQAEDTIHSEGYDYNVDVYYGNFRFPRKQYDNIVLPEGNYDAVRVEIGKAEGNNWWCVMFPPLCFVDFGNADENKPVFDVDTEKKLKEVLTEEEIDSIKTRRGLEDIKLKSKIFELIEKGKVENTGVYSKYHRNVYAYSLTER